MTRELEASAVLTAAELSLIGLHRLLPQRSLPELLTASAQVGDPIRIAMLHLATCETCHAQALVGEGRCCDRGARLLAVCHGWRPRGDAA